MMFVSIDMDNLQFAHKHAEHEVLTALAWLEMPHRSVRIENTTREFFLSNLTGLELRMLYRNTTALDITGTPHIVVREMLATLVEEKLKPTFAHLNELQAQIEHVEDDLYKGIPWTYALGARVPAKQEDLFARIALHCAPLAPDEAQEAVIRAPQRRQATPATPAARPAVTAPQPAAVPKARMSSVRPTIWAVADRMWQEAGSPKDPKAVLELRKKMMVVLETENKIKRTSSSNELGNWMKERLA